MVSPSTRPAHPEPVEGERGSLRMYLSNHEPCARPSTGSGRAFSCRLLFICCCCLAAWLPLRADERDVRLLEAVKRRDQKAFDALMRAKADVNGAQPDGATALAWAVFLGEHR